MRVATGQSNKAGQKTYSWSHIRLRSCVVVKPHPCISKTNKQNKKPKKKKNIIFSYTTGQRCQHLGPVLQVSRIWNNGGNTTEITKTISPLLSHQTVLLSTCVYAEGVTTPETHGTMVGAFGWLFLYDSEYLSLKFSFGCSACNSHWHYWMRQFSLSNSNLDELKNWVKG